MTLFHRRFAVLDGGFGTTLEDVFHKDISAALWSAKPIDSEAEVIVDAHLAFLRAGADIISTSTYQCAFSTFEKSSYTREKAIELMRKAVKLADEARMRHLSECPSKSRADVKIALSLGPYGATLSPAQEFDGFYPPPYGPRAYDPSDLTMNTNSFSVANDEALSVDKLAEFHLERLNVFLEDDATWNLVDCIAFETVPLTREIRAIRRAMSILHANLLALGKSNAMKPFWISTVWPSGMYPDIIPHLGHVSAEDVANALLRVEDDEVRPDGLGINCTNTESLPPILEAWTALVQNIPDGAEPKRPWLVVYPNGGDVYDIVKRTWDSGAAGKGEAWANRLVRTVAPFMDRWERIILGGCCKTTPAEIAALTAVLRAVDIPSV